MPGRFGLPFPYHLPNLVHLDIFLFFLRVIFVDFGNDLVICGFQ